MIKHRQEQVTILTYFLLSFIGLSESSFGADNNFINCYLADDTMIAVKVRDAEDVHTLVTSSPYLISNISLGENTLILFQIPTEYKGDIEMLKRGKYSRISDKAKKKVENVRFLSKTNWLVQVMNRDDKRRLKMMEELDAYISPDAELRDAPSPSNFIKLEELIEKEA